jgi:hypothetical protein
MYVCMHACMYVCMYACAYVYVYVTVNVNVNVNVCVYAYVCVCIYIYSLLDTFPWAKGLGTQTSKHTEQNRPLKSIHTAARPPY